MGPKHKLYGEKRLMQEWKLLEKLSSFQTPINDLKIIITHSSEAYMNRPAMSGTVVSLNRIVKR